MRRTLFNLIIALPVFGISSFFVCDSYWKQTDKQLPIIKQSKTESNVESENHADNTFKASDDEAVDEKIDEVIELWLEKKDIKEYAEIKSNESNGIERIAARMKVMDVNNDKSEELVVQTRCAPVGNCDLWIFEKYMHGFNLILKAKMVQTFKLRRSKTNGYFDLETKSHGDAFSGGISVYKFNGEKYEVSECSDYNYSYLKNGKFYIAKKPKITPRECVRQQ